MRPTFQIRLRFPDDWMINYSSPRSKVPLEKESDCGKQWLQFCFAWRGTRKWMSGFGALLPMPTRIDARGQFS